MKNQYELMVILKSSASAEDEKKFIEQVGKHIKDKGKMVTSTSLGKKPLAYLIQKEQTGNFILIKLELVGKEVGELSEKLKLEQVVLRHLFIKKDSKE